MSVADSTPHLPDLEPRYRDQVAARLTETLAKARRADVVNQDLDTARIVVFSDHHKGARDGADDFQRSERAYCAALGYYLESGYRLFVLGDAEELWEETPERVLGCYEDVLALEAEFQDSQRGGLERFFGNHDDLWQRPSQVERHLAGTFPGLTVRESLLLPLEDDGRVIGELFFVHGHQGTTESDRYGRWARLPVRYLWRPLQRKLGYSATTPASEFGLRGTHDRAMFEWARAQPRTPPTVLVTGHTHRPVFSLPDPPARSTDVINQELAAARSAGNVTAISALRAELEHALAVARDRNAAALTVSPPCYFNTGCCSFPDGDITGLEIDNGEIRLVRWPDDEEDPQRRLLGSKFLRDVFAEIDSTPPSEGTIQERLP